MSRSIVLRLMLQRDIRKYSTRSAFQCKCSDVAELTFSQAADYIYQIKAPPLILYGHIWCFWT